jgi:hypothetical protein
MGNLVNLTDVKTFLQVTGTATDTLLNMYTDIIEAEVEAYTHRTLIRGTYTEPVDYKASKYDRTAQSLLDASHVRPKFFLKNAPVVNLTLVNDEVTISATEYFLDEQKGVIDGKAQYDTSDEKVVATYVAGYNTITCPTDLKSVIYQGIRAIFVTNAAATAGKATGQVKSKGIKDFNVAYDVAGTAYITSWGTQGAFKPYLESNKTILKKYTRVNI